jgi:hypothetical protein
MNIYICIPYCKIRNIHKILVRNPSAKLAPINFTVKFDIMKGNMVVDIFVGCFEPSGSATEAEFYV